MADQIDTSRPPRVIDADLWHLYLSENRDALPMVAVQLCELFEDIDRANDGRVKDAFERGYKGGLGFAIGVCDEKDADLQHVKTRCAANLASQREDTDALIGKLRRYLEISRREVAEALARVHELEAALAASDRKEPNNG